MKLFTTFIFGLLAQFASAQTIYLDSIYSDVKKTTYEYSTIENEILSFDYYVAQKDIGELPLLVFVHGGGFLSGTRDGKKIVNFAERIAHRGYAVASVSYRLTMKNIGFGCQTEAVKKIAAFNSASHDISVAVEYIIKHNDTFHINPNKIILIGSSAGAETVLNMVYVYDNKILPSGFKFAGVISMAGAITTTEKINNKTAIPTQLFHGTGDALVPYSMAPHHYCSSKDAGYLMLYGSNVIAERLKGLGKSYYFYTINGGSHNWSVLPMTKCFNDIIDFLFYDVLNNCQRQTERTINTAQF